MNQRNTVFYVFSILVGVGVMFFSLFMIFPIMNNVLFSFTLLVPIILLFVFLAIARALTTGAIEERTTRYIKCPHCEKEISARATYCQHCGKPVSKKVVCDYCGQLNASDEMYCIKCNALLDTEDY